MIPLRIYIKTKIGAKLYSDSSCESDVLDTINESIWLLSKEHFFNENCKNGVSGVLYYISDYGGKVTRGWIAQRDIRRVTTESIVKILDEAETEKIREEIDKSLNWWNKILEKSGIY